MLNVFNWQEQIIIGTILGGSSLTKPPKGKNYYLSMRNINSLWLEYKVHELRDYYFGSPVKKYGSSFRANTPCLEKLTQIHNFLYGNDDREINMDVLDSLKDIGLAIWYLDGGSRTGRDKKNAYLNVTKLGDKGAELVKRYFNSVNMPCKINKSKKRIRILFSIQGTIEFFKIIAHCFPPFMYYKLEGL